MFLKMNHNEIKKEFEKEFQGVQDTRSSLHKQFADQGIMLIEQRREVIKIIITISVGIIAVPKIFDFSYNQHLYYAGIVFFVLTVILSLMHLKEIIDLDESKSLEIRGLWLPILDKRIALIKVYLGKLNLTTEDVHKYSDEWHNFPELDELDKFSKLNEGDLEKIKTRGGDYASSFIMFLFVSGAFFIAISILYKNIQTHVIVLSEILILVGTANQFSNKIIFLYSKLINFIKK